MIDRMWRAGLFVAYRAARAWWFVRRPSVRSAYVAVWWDGRLLVIRNSYKRGETVPCGGLRRGESPRSGARRELEEEVGIAVAESALVPALDWVMEHESTRDHVHFFEVHLADRPAVQVDRREVVWGEFFGLEELASRPLNRPVRHYLSARDDEPRPA